MVSVSTTVRFEPQTLFETVPEFIESRLIPLSFVQGRYCEMSALACCKGR